MFLKIFFILSTIFGTSFSFVNTISSISDIKSLDNIVSKPKKVVLFTGNGCRACINFKKKFNRLSEESPNVSMFEIVLNDLNHDDKTRTEILKFSNRMGIKVVPTVLIEDENESCKFSGVRKNYDDIEAAVLKLNTLT